jgi:hypothetical protein
MQTVQKLAIPLEVASLGAAFRDFQALIDQKALNRPLSLAGCCASLPGPGFGE